MIFGVESFKVEVFVSGKGAPLFMVEVRVGKSVAPLMQAFLYMPHTDHHI